MSDANKVLHVVELEDGMSVELQPYGYLSHRWAFCREHRVVRWILYDTLEWHLLQKIVGEHPYDVQKVDAPDVD